MGRRTSEPRAQPIEQGTSLQGEVEDECRVDEPKRPSASQELLEPELKRILQDSKPHGNTIASEFNLHNKYVRSPVLEKKLFETQTSPIPPAVRKLILKLGSDITPQSIELKDLQSLRFGTLFGAKHEFEGADQKWANLSAERVSSIRLMLITAVGNCPTLKALKLGNSHKLPRFHLTLQELQELLEPLQSSQVILELNLDGHNILETEDGCRILETFLANNRTLETLHIFDSDLNLHIIESLVSNGHSSLRNLRLYLNPTEDGVFDIVRGILQACPKLQEMPNVEWRCDDEEDAKRWAEILTKHDSFNAVEIAGRVESLAVFLLRVLDSSCQFCARKTLRKLKMMSLDDQLQQMPEHIVSLTVSANRNLDTVDLVGICISSDEWQEVFKTLKQNAVLRNLQLEDMQQGFDSGAWKELGALVEASLKLEVLTIHDHCCDVQPSVEYVFRAMQINGSLKKVKLLLSGHEIDKRGVSALVKFLEMNDVLEYLALDGCIIPNLEDVFRSLRRNSKLRKLGLYSCKGLNDDAYRELLGALRVNSAIREVNLTHTYWVTDGNKEWRWATPCEATQARERRDRYMRVMREFWDPTSNNFELLKAKLNFGDRW